MASLQTAREGKTLLVSQDPSGWMPDATRTATAAYGYSDVREDDMWPQAVISHVMQGYQSTMIGWAQERPYFTPKSAHFTISRDGNIVQHVSIWDPCWAAGDVKNPVEAGATLIRTNGPNPNKWAVSIEHEGFSIPPNDYGYDHIYSAENPWPEAMIEASIRVHQFVFYMCQNWMKPTERTVITHSMTNTVDRAQDPGDLWLETVRPRIIAALQGPPPPPSVKTYEDGLREGEAVGYAKGRERGWSDLYGRVMEALEPLQTPLT